MTPSEGTRSKVADDWLSRYGNNYGSHATNHHEVVLTSKRLNCAEEILRKTGKVESESTGYAGRSITSIEDFKDTFSVPFIKLVKRSSKTNAYKEVWVLPKFSESAVNFEALKTHSKFKDKGSFWTVTLNFNEEEQEELQDFLGNKEVEAKAVLSFKRDPIPDSSLKADENNGRPVDRQLREVYKYILKKGLNQSTAHEILGNMRNDKLGTSIKRLSNTIAIEKNGVRWSYGPIAILIGNPKDKVSTSDEWERDLDGREFRLKAPYQVDYGFYHVSMADQDILILGPKILLDKYRSRSDVEEGVKERFLDIESLSSEQRRLFNIRSAD